jgi:hypothetical protein
MEPWTGAQSAFALRAFYRNSDSFVIAQREFRREFGNHRNFGILNVNMRVHALSVHFIFPLFLSR